MCILLLFNSADKLSYADIQEATQVTELADGSKGTACVCCVSILVLSAPRHTTRGRLSKGLRTALVRLVSEMSARFDAASAAATAIVRSW